MDEREVLGGVSGWLARRHPDRGRPTLTALGKPGSGYSAENLVIDARWDDGHKQRLILRRDTPDRPIYPAQSPGTTTGVLFQHSVMDALRRTGRVPVADSLGLEMDPQVLGTPFFVMGHVPGDVPGESPPYTQAGFFVDASPSERARLITEGLRALARVHEMDTDDPGLVALRTPGVRHGAERQLEVWESDLRGGLAGRTSPVIDDCLRWLHDQLPAADPVVFSWGDSRPGNMIWQDFQVACLTDFEGAALGPRALDVGWWLMCDRWMHEGSGTARLAGEPVRSEQRAIYEEAAGTSVGGTIWYEVFSALRFATTVVQVMNRWVARGAVPKDQTVWRDNPATAVLADLLNEATGERA
ncbi:MAG TPA: phosphotransferase family protein [Acidimicrobiales bacterium]|jgi:aminoglycoside phosphotransferase (APT) family kinase protein|nr:phosphotransferase family protein [Acidimicrobiales bacterium]